MDINAILIELAMVILGIVMLVAALALPERGKTAVGGGMLAGLGVIGIIIVAEFFHSVTLFDGIYISDVYSHFFKMLTVITLFIVVLSSMSFVKTKFGAHAGEFYSFLCFAAVGMMLLSSAGEMITIYIGLEIMTISFYIITAFCLDDMKSLEAGLKYLILGAMSSAFLLLGMSFIFAMTGTTVISDIAMRITLSPAIVAGVALMLVGFAFKASLFPFHMWTPDIYHGAPTPVTMALSVGSKAAAFAVMGRVLLTAFPMITVAGSQWQTSLVVLAAITIVFGNLVAIPQRNIKRMLAYSSIAQAGYIACGVLSVNDPGLLGVLYYALLYVFANLGALAVVCIVELKTGSSEFDALAGLSRRSPFLAAVMTVSLLSLAGIPPLAGFIGKLYIFTGVIAAGYTWLAALALIMSMVAAFYYLNVAKVMYADEPIYEDKVKADGPASVGMVLCLLGTLLMGVYPAPIATIAQYAEQFFLYLGL